jgi:RNA polymerase sigma-70 factor (ECF subfamily)
VACPSPQASYASHTIVGPWESRLSSKVLQQELVFSLPNMRAFAISLCGDTDRADDLVQEAVLKAWRHLDSYSEGTNLRAWLFTILRNTFLSKLRQQRDELSLDAELGDATWLAVASEQHGRLEGRDMQKALLRLHPDQRAAIILVGAEGFSYQEAAEVCGCAIGTVKSWVNRARMILHQLLDGGAALAPRNNYGVLEAAHENAQIHGNEIGPTRHEITLRKTLVS